MEETINEESILLMEDHYGVYLASEFWAKHREQIENLEEIKDEWPEDLDQDLSHPDQDFYWDAFEHVMDNAVLVLETPQGKKKYKLYQDGDLWAIPL